LFIQYINVDVNAGIMDGVQRTTFSICLSNEYIHLLGDKTICFGAAFSLGKE